MKTISCIVLVSILFVTSVYSLIECPDFTKVRRSVSFYPMNVICDLITHEVYAKSNVYYINANFTTETCTYSPLTRAFISPKFIISVDNKIIYRRGPESHTIRPPCLPARAEYLTGDVYFLIESILTAPAHMFPLEESFRDAACSNFLDEAANITSGNSTYEEKLKFIRRVTASDGLIGDIQDGKIYYVRCDIINLPIVDKGIIECDCFYGAMVKTSDGNGWYSKNGLDIIGKAEVNECIWNTNSSFTIKRSIGFNSGIGGTGDSENFFSRLFKVGLLELGSFSYTMTLMLIILLKIYCFCVLINWLFPYVNLGRSQGTKNIGSHISHA
uniref:Glycoprotein n=1 Tax=Strongyloides papillosus TaxID=174720 RepID=A0A0N5BPU0_STREA